MSLSKIDEAVDSYLKQVLDINSSLSAEIVAKAYRYALVAHDGQFRKSGEPYIIHPVAVSLILAEQQLDSVTIAAGLLHDVLEDTSITRKDLETTFGSEIVGIVDGVTKIKTFQNNTRDRQESQAETFRKMLLSMAEDLRVIIVKFADRLHNLRTLNYLSPDRIKDIATETMDIYAPLANRLGMARIKWELEDLAFKHSNPAEYKNIVSRVVEDRRVREARIASFIDPLRTALKKESIAATVVGRPKNFYSIYRKMITRNKKFEEIYDLLAIRIITKTVGECYQILGIIHMMWPPMSDRFKDYIATPKSNGYQSLHTTIVGNNGNIVEMQIRTWEMNNIAEDGIAAHWLYKEGRYDKDSNDTQAVAWLKNLVEWQKDLTDSNEFMEFFKIDLFHTEIFVFTPKGKLCSLPKGATVLDFAFEVHTELGYHCIGARVDGRLMPLHSVLKSGSTVEILHQSSKKVDPSWLRCVKTSKARSAINRWLKSSRKKDSIDIGRKMIKSKIDELHLSDTFDDHISSLLKYLGISTLEQLYNLVGAGNLPINRVFSYFQTGKLKRRASSRVVSRFVKRLAGKKNDVTIGGDDGTMIRFAKCCNPVPGDGIIGFLTNGRGISVHRITCNNVPLFSKDKDRVVDVTWDNAEERTYSVFLVIDATDRKGLLSDITNILADCGASIIQGTIGTENNHVHNTFQLEIMNRNQLKQILRRIQKLNGIISVNRTRDRAHFL